MEHYTVGGLTSTAPRVYVRIDGYRRVLHSVQIFHSILRYIEIEFLDKSTRGKLLSKIR